jgi:hypothetical protein
MTPCGQATAGGYLDGRAEDLRALYRLRAGVPPFDRIEELSVGHDSALRQLRSFVESPVGVARTLLVTGDYGEGKSHWLGALRQLALKTGLAVCYMSADGWANALNHPQRFLPLLFSTLEVPGHGTAGYRDFLYTQLLDIGSARRIASLLERRFDGRVSAERTCREDLDRLLRAMADPDAIDVAGLRTMVTGYLTGESSRHRSATPEIRLATYSLIQVCADLARAAGAKGLLLLVDETESIFTKLPTVLSRYGAFRVLAALSHGGRLTHCKVAMGLTPDAVRWTNNSASDLASDPRALADEPVRRFTDDFTRAQIPEVQCGRLSFRHRHALLDRIKAIHERAMCWSLSAEQTDRWARFTERAAEKNVPLRVLVRSGIDFLDTQHCGLGG